jgi:predicted transposase YbfD/YdcC
VPADRPKSRSTASRRKPASPTPARRKPRRRREHARGRNRKRPGVRPLRIPSLLQFLEEIPDHRSPKGRRHALSRVLCLVLLGVLCQQIGYKSTSRWARGLPDHIVRRLGFAQHGVPAACTLLRVLAGLDWDAFSSAIHAWAKEVFTALKRAGKKGEKPALALDGKFLRGSLAQGSEAIGMLVGALHGIAVAVGQAPILRGQGELTVTPELLEKILEPECVVTGDAQFNQTAVAKAIVEKRADYVLTVRGNQPTLEARAESLLGLAGPPRKERRVDEDVEGGRGRIIRRHIVAVDVTEKQVEWPGARQVFRVIRTIYNTRTGKQTTALTYYVTSLSARKAGPGRLLALVRGHWSIETAHFWVRDVVLGEDRSRVRNGAVARCQAVMRGVAITMLKAAGFSGVSEGRRWMNSNPVRACALLGL